MVCYAHFYQFTGSQYQTCRKEGLYGQLQNIHNGFNEYNCIPRKCLHNIALETFTNKKYIKSNIILIFDIKENEGTYNRQLMYQQIYVMNV